MKTLLSILAVLLLAQNVAAQGILETAPEDADNLIDALQLLGNEGYEIKEIPEIVRRGDPLVGDVFQVRKTTAFATDLLSAFSLAEVLRIRDFARYKEMLADGKVIEIEPGDLLVVIDVKQINLWRLAMVYVVDSKGRKKSKPLISFFNFFSQKMDKKGHVDVFPKRLSR